MTEQEMKDRVKAFLNSLPRDGAYLFWRFLRTKTWTEWVNARVNGQTIK